MNALVQLILILICIGAKIDAQQGAEDLDTSAFLQIFSFISSYLFLIF